MGFDSDTHETSQRCGLIRTSELDSVSTTMITPYPGTPFHDVVESENRLLDVPWSHYDTAHLTFVPRTLQSRSCAARTTGSVAESTVPRRSRARGMRSLGRYPISKAGKKAFGSFSTDYGYRRTYAYRNAV